MTLSEILDFKLLELDGFSLSVSNVLMLAVIIIGARALIWTIGTVIKRGLLKRGMDDVGRQYAVIRIAKYFIYTISVFLAVESLGFDVQLILASATALFLGIGLGLQSVVNDIVSGLILLFEGSTKVGDMVQIDDATGIIESISLRTSQVRTRDNITMVVPNSKLVNDNVINWSHNEKKRRFHVRVGVAYGSDTALVKKTLIDVAIKNEDILQKPEAVVFFENFGESSLDFDLMVWTDKTWQAEQIKSDLRFEIDTAFRKAGIEIPFPQRDLHIKSGLHKT